MVGVVGSARLGLDASAPIHVAASIRTTPGSTLTVNPRLAATRVVV